VLRASAPKVGEAAVGPVGATLYVAWAGVLAAIAAVGLVVRAIIDLGERRGRFVSAVTHELRTPLTTFCLYSEMLADDMVRDEKSKREYLTTLKRESQRLAKIVENVLCYARLAEVRASAQTQALDAGELLDRVTPALARRAAEAGMQLVVETNSARGVTIDVDPQTVERILTNLVDNACKYARGYAVSGVAEDHRIHLVTHAAPGRLEIRIADHGPGIPRAHRRKVFRPFSRAGIGEAHAAPGLGLGLSLARGLARELGGDLRLGQIPDSFASGTVMCLVLPATVAAGVGELASSEMV
jgi:signal transduction histidine kinase